VPRKIYNVVRRDQTPQAKQVASNLGVVRAPGLMASALLANPGVVVKLLGHETVGASMDDLMINSPSSLTRALRQEDSPSSLDGVIHWTSL
jgi:hypothetical protein